MGEPVHQLDRAEDGAPSHTPLRMLRSRQAPWTRLGAPLSHGPSLSLLVTSMAGTSWTPKIAPFCPLEGGPPAASKVHGCGAAYSRSYLAVSQDNLNVFRFTI